MCSKRILTAVIAIAASQGGCGLTVPQQPEVWDRSDPRATQHMEMQIKRAVFCELRNAIHVARGDSSERYFGPKVVTQSDDQPLPDSWGIQITFKFTVDETGKFSPGASFNVPLPSATTTFVGHPSVSTSQSFAFGLGGTLSSQATRIDTYDTFYTVGDIAYVFSKNNVCDVPNPDLMGPASSSSPLLVQSNLGISDWLPQAYQVSDFLRSTRASENGEGPPMPGNSGHASDSLSYDIKYIIVSSVNATPMWKLVRVIANTTSPLLDLNRTRTHELIITIGPSTAEKAKTASGKTTVKFVPSQSAINSHLAQQIGSAVAAALRAPQ